MSVFQYWSVLVLDDGLAIKQGWWVYCGCGANFDRFLWFVVLVMGVSVFGSKKC